MSPIHIGGLSIGVPFTPPSLPGLVLWLDATQITGVSGGASLGTWPDESGNGFDAVQTSGPAKPIYALNQINGLPAVVFSQTSFQTLLCPNEQYVNGTDGSWSCFVVGWSTNAGGGITNAVNGDQAANSPTVRIAQFIRIVGTYSLNAVEVGHGSATGGSPSITTVNVFGAVCDTSTIAARLNSVQVASASNGGALVLGTCGLDISNRNNGSNAYWNGPMGEVLFYNRALTGTEIAELETYLTAKWV
jgi:hypothetical protein